jgi:signal transduction histidine kinase
LKITPDPFSENEEALPSELTEDLVFGITAIPLSSTIKFHSNVTMNERLVNADSTQINQLVVNLCSNAVQSMTPQGRSLYVSLDETIVTQSTLSIGNDLNCGKHMKLTVSDTGSGINPEIMKNIFEPSFSTRKSDKGTGLGLAIVYEIVKNSQGSIRAYSEAEKGTRVEIFFPIFPRCTLIFLVRPLT